MTVVCKMFLILVVAVWFGLSSQPAARAIAPDQVIKAEVVEVRAVFINGELRIWEVA